MAAITTALVTTIIDRDGDDGPLDPRTVTWLAVNTIRTACLGAASWQLLSWRRHETSASQMPPGRRPTVQQQLRAQIGAVLLLISCCSSARAGHRSPSPPAT